MKADGTVDHDERACSSSDVVAHLDSLIPSERIAEIERRLEAHAGAMQRLEVLRADALRQLRRERLSLSQMGALIGATRQQVHRLLRVASDELASGELLYVAGGVDRPVEVGAELERDGVRYRVVRVQRMQPLAEGASAPWAVLGVPVGSNSGC